VLVAAKQRGWLASVGGLLNRLETEAGFRLSQSVKAAALQAVGE
jgi:predicted nucleic acid-binding protein